MLKEFKEFAIKGNVVDMAVGIVIGSAFTAIVNSLVKDIITPPLGALMGGLDFKDQFFVLRGAPGGARDFTTLAEAQAAGAVTLNGGMFLNAVLQFLIVSFAMFLLVKYLLRIKKQPEVKAAAATKDCPRCAMSIPIKASRCPHCTTDLP
jgi:large conductance mechanosensitive channel